MSAELIAELREIVRKRADCLCVQEAAAISEAADALSSLALAERGQPEETQAQRDEAMTLKRRNARLKAWETRRSKGKRT